MFRTEKFIEECVNALKKPNAHSAVQEIVARTVSDPNDVIRGLGEPKRAGVQTLYHSAHLTIINFTWGPRMSLPPHDHRMWAVIGLYGGKEDNMFYRRSVTGLQRSGAKELSAKDACPLGAAVIHSVINPLDKITAAIHVYGGDYFGVPRSQWDAKTLEEQPFDVAYIMGLFEESNKALVAARD
jgi:predicted metal-dependent enzyme (double-stranded beta helix superfamily)